MNSNNSCQSSRKKRTTPILRNALFAAGDQNTVETKTQKRHERLQAHRMTLLQNDQDRQIMIQSWISRLIIAITRMILQFIPFDYNTI